MYAGEGIEDGIHPEFHGAPGSKQLTFKGKPMSGHKPLIGDVSVQLIWTPGSTSLEFALEAACIDQEAMVGYPLKLKSWRETQTGGDRREVFATFEPRT